MNNQLNAKIIAMLAVMIAVVAVVTLAVRVPIPGTPSGYVNLSDAAIYFAAFAFGPWAGLVAGGVGAAIADAIGFPQFIFLTFFAHGLQGLVAGYLGGRTNLFWRMLLGWAVGAVVMVAIYYLGEVAGIAGYTPPQAAIEVPSNIVQTIAGGLLGIPLVYAVRKAYPPINQIGFGSTCKEA